MDPGNVQIHKQMALEKLLVNLIRVPTQVTRRGNIKLCAVINPLVDPKVREFELE